MTQYMLDTNICIYIIKKQPPPVLKKFETLLPEQVFISSVSWGELVYGGEKSQHREKNRRALNNFIHSFSVLSFDQEAASDLGILRAHLETKGQMIGIFDLMIAAHARAMNMRLVTNNEREFRRVPDLNVENWVK